MSLHLLQPNRKPSFAHTQRYGLNRNHFIRNSTSGLWALNEGGGNTVVDLSGSGNDGTISGALWGSDNYGATLAFDGVSDRVEIPDSPTVRAPSSGITIIVRATFPTDVGSESYPGVVYKKYDTVSPFISYGIAQLSANDRSFRMSLSTSALGNIVSSTVTAPANEVVFLVGRWVSGEKIQFDVYREDGSLVGTGLSASTLGGTIIYTSEPLRFGQNEGTSNLAMDLSFVHIDSSRRTDAEIQSFIQNTNQIFHTGFNLAMFGGLAVAANIAVLRRRLEGY